MQPKDTTVITPGPEHADSRYYQVVFIWLKDPVMFERYIKLLEPVVRPYGGALERQLAPDTIYAESMSKPDIVNVVFYDSPAAFEAFDRDPEFQQIVQLRSESIDMVAVGGLSIAGTPTKEQLDQRLYLVELARFGPNGAQGYQQYEAQAELVMGRYGYHIERRLAPDSVSSLPFQPDLVKVAYFDQLDGLERFHHDPAHEWIENQLYSAAVEQSIWVVARVHPATVE